MAKDKKGKFENGAFFEMLKNVSGTKQIPQIHRGSLLCLLSNAVYPDQRNDNECSYIVRLPFSDYGDLTVDNRCLEYLKQCKRTLDTEYNFAEMVDELKSKGETIKDNVYRHYCEWLAIKAVFDFLYIGDYYENEPDNDPDGEYDPISDIA